MFTDEVNVSRSDDGRGLLVKPHKAFEEGDPELSRLVGADYLEHFPFFNEVIDLIAAARFASDRRRAFVWLHACAGFGKSLLLSALKDLGIVLELNETEIEKALDDSPMGKDLSQNANAWVLAVDEFSRVKREFKQINSSITGAAKNRLSVTIPVYTKVFLSAESVASLAGDAGVESQFADRFSYLTGDRPISERQLFTELGGETYKRGLSGYIARRLNEAVEGYRALGREKAAVHGEATINEFHARHGITRDHGSLSDTVDDIVEALRREVRDWLDDNVGGAPCDYKVLVDADGVYYVVLLRCNRWVQEHIESRFTRSEVIKVGFKAGTITDRLSDRGSSSQMTEVVWGSNRRLLPGERKKRKGPLFEVTEENARRLLEGDDFPR